MEVNTTDITKLAELLNPKRFESEDSEDETTQYNTGTTSKKDEQQNPSKLSVYSKITTEERTAEANVESVEDEDALFFDKEAPTISNWRLTPQWSICYKQEVGASDVFLQIGRKGPSTASCEDMILKIDLPAENHRNIDLKVVKDRVTLTSPKFKLDMPLPHPVNPKCGNAKWDKDSEQLIVTLRMDREFDYVNF